MENFTILTINTWKCDGVYPERIHWMASEIERLNPDIIVCQEVFWTTSGKYDTLKLLQSKQHKKQSSDQSSVDKSRLKYASFSAARVKDRNINGQFLKSASGLGILSVYPIIDSFAFNLPDHPADGERIAQFSIVEVNTARLLVINTHLTHLKVEYGLRLNQIEAILSQNILKESFDAVLLCGDFNCTEDGITIQYLYQHPEFKVSNAFRRAEVQSARHITLPKKPVSEMLTPKADDGRCIDYIFILEKSSQSTLKVDLAQVVLDNPNNAGEFPSDHFGVMASIKVKSKSSKPLSHEFSA